MPPSLSALLEELQPRAIRLLVERGAVDSEDRFLKSVALAEADVDAMGLTHRQLKALVAAGVVAK